MARHPYRAGLSATVLGPDPRVSQPDARLAAARDLEPVHLHDDQRLVPDTRGPHEQMAQEQAGPLETWWLSGRAADAGRWLDALAPGLQRAPARSAAGRLSLLGADDRAVAAPGAA